MAGTGPGEGRWLRAGSAPKELEIRKFRKLRGARPSGASRPILEQLLHEWLLNPASPQLLEYDITGSIAADAWDLPVQRDLLLRRLWDTLPQLEHTESRGIKKRLLQNIARKNLRGDGSIEFATKLLGDSAQLGTRFGFEFQMRDLALVALAQLTGTRPTEFHLTEVQGPMHLPPDVRDPEALYYYENQSIREQGLAKWRTWAEENLKAPPAELDVLVEFDLWTDLNSTTDPPLVEHQAETEDIGGETL